MPDAEDSATEQDPARGGSERDAGLVAADGAKRAMPHEDPQHAAHGLAQRSCRGEPPWAPPPAFATGRPREAADDGSVRTAPRICPTLVDQIGGDPRKVRAALQTLCATLLALDLDTSDCTTLEIVLAEALNNIVEHAYRNEQGGWILLEVDYLRGWVVCRLTDGGLPMPGNALPPRRALGEGIEAGGAAGALPEGGFGWSMIYELTSELRYRRAGALNILQFALPLTSMR